MNKEFLGEDYSKAESMDLTEALSELDNSVKDVAKQLNKLEKMPPELSSAWQSLLRAREGLEVTIRHT
jgi:hypothetical protein